jgi:hypothetical protein
VNISSLERISEDMTDKTVLFKYGFIDSADSVVKILGTGEVSKKN